LLFLRTMSAALHELPAHAPCWPAYRRAPVPVEVTQAVLAHIERWEPHIRATYLLRPEHALAQARRPRPAGCGRAQGALDGVPVTIKDNIATAGDPMPLGTAATALVPAAADAPPAARLREAGAVIVAKTTMPDYGMLSSGLSSFHHWRATPGTCRARPAAPAPVPGAAAAPATARCTSAPTSAARCACRPAGAASSASSPAWAACPSTRPTPAAPPAP
jgi:aspartyl-tRNA(Asn)/glutamyl-tRNA(Gln) amidotransferase subunit A